MEEATQTTKPKAVRKRLSQERKDLIVSLRKSGKTQHYIRVHTGHSLGTIVKVLKEAKLIKAKKAPKKNKPIIFFPAAPTAVVNTEVPVAHILPVKTNFLQRIAISFCRGLGVTDRMYGEN